MEREEVETEVAKTKSVDNKIKKRANFFINAFKFTAIYDLLMSCENFINTLS